MKNFFIREIFKKLMFDCNFIFINHVPKISINSKQFYRLFTLVKIHVINSFNIYIYIGTKLLVFEIQWTPTN